MDHDLLRTNVDLGQHQCHTYSITKVKNLEDWIWGGLNPVQFSDYPLDSFTTLHRIADCTLWDSIESWTRTRLMRDSFTKPTSTTLRTCCCPGTTLTPELVPGYLIIHVYLTCGLVVSLFFSPSVSSSCIRVDYIAISSWPVTDLL